MYYEQVEPFTESARTPETCARLVGTIEPRYILDNNNESAQRKPAQSFSAKPRYFSAELELVNTFDKSL